MQSTRRRELKCRQMRTRTQREVLRDVMLSAGRCECWLTLEQLGKLTHYPPASISAQLRHLRKPEFGGYVVEKRLSEVAREDGGPVWEYRVSRRIRRLRPRTPARGTRRGECARRLRVK